MEHKAMILAQMEMPGFKILKEYYENSIQEMFEELLNTIRNPDKHDDSDLIRGQIRGIRFVFSTERMIVNYEINKKKLEGMKNSSY